MSHLQARLKERNTEKNYYDRKESNGDMVVLIVRGNNPVTIMYRRKNQNNTPEGLRVENLVNLTLQ